MQLYFIEGHGGSAGVVSAWSLPQSKYEPVNCHFNSLEHETDRPHEAQQ